MPSKGYPRQWFGPNRDSQQWDGLVGWWPFVQNTGNKIFDRSPGRRDLSLQNGATSSIDNRFGPVGIFDGTNDTSVSSTCPITSPAQTTLTAWIHLSSTSLRGSVVSVGSINGPPWFGWGVGIGNTDLDGTGNNLISDIRGIAWGNSNRGVGTGWHFIGLRFGDGTSGKPNNFWIDTATAGAPGGTPNSAALNQPVNVGGYFQNPVYARYFPGKIADARIYKKWLSNGELLALWNPDTRWELYQPEKRKSYFLGAGPVLTELIAQDSVIEVRSSASVPVEVTLKGGTSSFAKRITWPSHFPYTNEINRESQHYKNLLYAWPAINAAGNRWEEAGGTGRDIVLANGAVRTAGKFGSEVRFDGTNDYGSVALDLSAHNSLTLSFWMYWNAYANDDDLCMEFTPTANSNNGWFLDPNDSGDGRFSFRVGPASGQYYRFTRPSAAAWHHYAFRFNRGVAGASVVWVDGNRVALSTIEAETSLSGNFANSTLYIMSRAGSALFGAGRYADIRIYKGMIQGSVVRSLYAPETRWDLYSPRIRTSYVSVGEPPEPDFGVPESTIEVGATFSPVLNVSAAPSTIQINSAIVEADNELELSADFTIEILSSIEEMSNVSSLELDTTIVILSSGTTPNFVDNVYSEESIVEIGAGESQIVLVESVFAQDSEIVIGGEARLAFDLPVGESSIQILTDPTDLSTSITSDILLFVAGGTPIDESSGLSLYVKGLAPGSTEEFGGIDFFIDSEPQTEHINFVLSASAVSEGPQTDYVNFFLNAQDAFQDSASQSFILYNIREQDSASIGLFVEGEGTTPDSVPEDGYLNIILMNKGDSGSFDIFVKAPDGDTASIGFRINAVEGIESEEITVYVFGVGTENQNLPIFVRGFID
jgi:hypothetical protein